MKKTIAALLFAFASLSASAADATTTTPPPDFSALDLSNPNVKQALVTTQLLAASICHEQVNLDPKVLSQYSSAFAFILAFQTIAPTPQALAGDPGLLAKRMSLMKCGTDGVLQFTATES